MPFPLNLFRREKYPYWMINLRIFSILFFARNRPGLSFRFVFGDVKSAIQENGI
jgi:hypothetical protein